ncbi:right-handed parallel beta-helix repeat-containing protein [Phragmitibacter flavus]|uniref:Right-handed parallel beta-helix repeat-containing protein n=2 Tax=Phragmitibacter flavus TaxID=2576071 RepID=A0A5R8KEP0_9BACT|nr:right-handed parallel beta-helix repeat-containing protein [Phragmitibacter flavus]
MPPAEAVFDGIAVFVMHGIFWWMRLAHEGGNAGAMGAWLSMWNFGGAVDCESVGIRNVGVDMIRWFPTWCAVLFFPVMGWALEESDLQGFIDEAIKAGGGEVVVPPGEYVIKKGLKLVDGKGIRLAGMDKERTVLRWEGEEGGWLISVTGGASEKVSIGKLTLEGGNGVLIDGGKGAEVRDCLFQLGKGDGVLLKSGEGAVVESCSFRDIAGVGIKVAVVAKGAVVQGNWLTRCGTGIGVPEKSDALVLSNELVDAAAGVKAMEK